MFKKIIYTLLAFIAICLNFASNSYANESDILDETKTIKELNENINTLDKTTLDLDNELKTLNTDYELKAFLRRDLTILELNRIRKIASEYNTNKVEIEAKLLLKAKELEPIVVERRLLLEEKRNLYSGLIPYINGRYKTEYLDYIKRDAKIFNEQYKVTTNIITKKEILSTKVETIETRIKKHNDFINESIREIIESRLDEKINNLRANENFIELNTESKIKVLDMTIEKIKAKLEEFKITDTDTGTWVLVQINNTILTKKIDTYNIAVEKLEEFRDSLK